MKHSAAMNLKPNDDVVVNALKDGILWEIVAIHFPMFTLQEKGTNYKPQALHYSYIQRPTKAQINAYNKRKEKYYVTNNTSTTTSEDNQRTGTDD